MIWYKLYHIILNVKLVWIIDRNSVSMILKENIRPRIIFVGSVTLFCFELTSVYQISGGSAKFLIRCPKMWNYQPTNWYSLFDLLCVPRAQHIFPFELEKRLFSRNCVLSSTKSLMHGWGMHWTFSTTFLLFRDFQCLLVIIQKFTVAV